MKPIDRLFERTDSHYRDIPESLATAYGGDLGLAPSLVYANFVSSVDGIVALRQRGDSGAVISQDNEADRFVMGLLRAAADVVLIGATTFRKARGHLWHADAACPVYADCFAKLRTKLGLPRHPRLVILTDSGELGAEPGLEDALVITTSAGGEHLRGRLPRSAKLAVLDGHRLSMNQVLDCIRSDGHRAILVEGGPTVVSELAGQGLLDELFLTTSPTLFGREAGDGRKTLVDHELSMDLELLSLRRHGSHLFSRYAVKQPLQQVRLPMSYPVLVEDTAVAQA